MFNRAALHDKLRDGRLEGECWGKTGASVSREIESALKVKMSAQLQEFANFVGNVIVGPFSIVVSGDDGGRFSSISETAALEVLDSSLCPIIKIMDHAGESYIYRESDESIESYDSLNVSAGMATQRFESFALFVDWIFHEASRMRGTKVGEQLGGT